ncbi:membrane protein [Lachnospiraceae bacterium]|uniref:LrgB family protein n=1 Tax=Extibacter sp. GGCC_0201 TaxID=2731209 RepID=UPI001AA143B4|nr:LrgB family protein [Extibacter sp. GGCC_0201]MBO1722655.1 LrgB family protein [Extibacter sp. GGCC_0201]BDF34245.1 membrane protein [Lachnospiraceae bacterium]BDF38249.1 membrane protein [Lachnospiraceae bacterium]
MGNLWANPLFGIFLTVITFYIGDWTAKRIKSPLANPLLIAMVLCVAVLKLLDIPYKDYMEGGQFISLFLVPATAMIGLSIYRQRKVLKQQFFPIVIGCLAGSLISMGSTIVLCRLLALRQDMLASLLPKSVTTAIALDLSDQLGGLRSVTMMAVIICGTGGAIIHPFIIRLLKLKDPVATGVAFGTASHAIGTAKAIEMGEVEGAVSGVSMGIAGICTVIIALFL